MTWAHGMRVHVHAIHSSRTWRGRPVWSDPFLWLNYSPNFSSFQIYRCCPKWNQMGSWWHFTSVTVASSPSPFIAAEDLIQTGWLTYSTSSKYIYTLAETSSFCSVEKLEGCWVWLKYQQQRWCHDSIIYYLHIKEYVGFCESLHQLCSVLKMNKV